MTAIAAKVPDTEIIKEKIKQVGKKVEEKPNFVFLFADDQTFESISALGFDEVHTPNLDRLVNNGTSFTHAYNMGGWNGAICLASRAMIISGRSVWRAQQVSRNYSKNT